MPPRVALQLLSRPVARSIAEQLRPPTRITSPTWPSSSRSASRLARPSSICFRCSIQPQRRTQSTTPPSEPPKDNSEPKPDSNTTSSSSTSSSDPQSSTDTSSTPSPADAASRALPSTRDSLRPALQARFSTFMDTLQTRVMTASQRLNDLTGYSSIESIKRSNEILETSLHSAQLRLREARSNYKTLNNHRASTQREVTTLLARKDTWSPVDLERFTTLYRSDHELEAKVAAASAELTEAEMEESRLGQALNAGILRRYHEEQVWSDRIRRQSTWGTWGLMGVNVLLFIGLQFFAEPWKRKRLVKGFVEAESGVWEDVRREVGEVRSLMVEVKEGRSVREDHADRGIGAREELVEGGEGVVGEETVRELPAEGEAVAASTTELPPMMVEEMRDWDWWKEVVMDPSRWRGVVEDLYSERRIDLRMRDASILALEGAVTGAAVAAGVVFMLLRRS
ncbi:Mdm33 family-domain-containing protein [Coniochaeta sp. 2T2.1]|nr:Mdm33 family-domain-containing protein [Coniochaeta sp. 2T2.1]